MLDPKQKVVQNLLSFEVMYVGPRLHRLPVLVLTIGMNPDDILPV